MAYTSEMSAFEKQVVDRCHKVLVCAHNAKGHTVCCWISAGIIILEIFGFVWIA